jgi:HlyD family secretion protein
VERAEAAVQSQKAQLAELEAGYRKQEVEQARLAVEKTRSALKEAARDKERFERLYARKIVAAKEKEAVDLTYDSALRDFERAREAYHLLKEGYRKETIQTARARLNEALAALRQSRSNLKKIEIAERELDVAGTRVEEARSALQAAEIRLTQTILLAPFDGILVSRNIEPGEVVSPSREVLSIADLSEVDLKIFVDETQIGTARPGQDVDVKIDTFPEKTYHGTVSFISPEAEFTPKIIQTHKERVKLVYLVKVRIPNPNLELKPGMPADAWLR